MPEEGDSTNNNNSESKRTTADELEDAKDAAATGEESPLGPVVDQRIHDDAQIDEESDESFPASDPPGNY